MTHEEFCDEVCRLMDNMRKAQADENIRDVENCLYQLRIICNHKFSELEAWLTKQRGTHDA